MKVTLGECQHESRRFLDDRDTAQRLYENTRKATLDRRIRIAPDLLNTIHAHGVAGLFIDPDRFLLSVSAPSRASSRRGTALYHARLANNQFDTIATSLAEGVSIAATARIQKTNEKSVTRVVVKAARHARQVTHALLRNVKVSECQLDEMWSFVGNKEKNLGVLEELARILGDAWIWIAFDAVNKIILAYVVGKRTTEYAIQLVKEVKRVTISIPDLFSSDQLSQYPAALLQEYGRYVYPPHKPGPGRLPKPRLVPSPELRYVQVVKKYKQNRVVEVTRKVVFGDPEEIDRILAASPVSKKINTAYIERCNGTARHINARCVRKTYCFSKSMEHHEHQLALSFAYYHLCRSHKTLSKRYSRPTTPFMAAGITDHVWTMAELLRFTPKIPCS